MLLNANIKHHLTNLLILQTTKVNLYVFLHSNHNLKTVLALISLRSIDVKIHERIFVKSEAGKKFLPVQIQNSEMLLLLERKHNNHRQLYLGTLPKRSIFIIVWKTYSRETIPAFFLSSVARLVCALPAFFFRAHNLPDI